MTDDNAFHLFDTRTMSGVHPGSRSARFHIVRLQTIAAPSMPRGWARILWPGETERCAVYRQAGDSWEQEPFLQLSASADGQLVPALADALASAGQAPLVCGTCRWWQPVVDATSEDGIPLGLCTKADDDKRRPELTVKTHAQSALAMDCPHWQTGAQPPRRTAIEPPVLSTSNHPSGWWSGLKNRLARKTDSQTPASRAEIVERSGVGAGTERCLACHGRMANLGALTVAAESNDKRTLSVWRCRNCHTFYLNDWIDRWERLDSLETEESFYRITPGEALTLLRLFGETQGGAHPQERHTRVAQRTEMDAFLVDRPRLLHQMKQGR